jgi:hypothetical protein
MDVYPVKELWKPFCYWFSLKKMDDAQKTV